MAVWIAKEFKDEHRQALDWLNQRSDENTEFFGVVIEVWKIDDSRPAPHFKLERFTMGCSHGGDQGDFMGRSRRRVDGDRKTMAVCHRHELRPLTPLGRSHIPSVFFATMKGASMKHSLRSTSPRVRKSSAKASRTARSTPARTHCWKRRWQVW